MTFRLSAGRRWWYLLLAGFLLRFLWVILLHPPQSAIYSDMAEYLQVASDYARGTAGARATLWHGLMTHILAACIKLTGSVTVYAWIQFALSCITLYLTACLARQLLPERAGLAVVAAQALDVLQIHFAGFFMGEVLCGAFLIASVALLLVPERAPVHTLGAGVFLGLAGLSREYALLCAVPMAVWVMRNDGARRISRLVLLGSSCVLVMFPQVCLNQRLAGKFALGTTRTPRYLAYAWSMSRSQMSLPDGETWTSPVYTSNQPIAIPTRNSVELHFAGSLDASYWNKVRNEEILRNPEIFLFKLRHVAAAWVLLPWPTSDESGFKLALAWLVQGFYLFIVLPFYLAQISEGMREREMSLLNGIALCLFLMCLLGHGQASYRIPFQPIFLILAARGSLRGGSVRVWTARSLVAGVLCVLAVGFPFQTPQSLAMPMSLGPSGALKVGGGSAISPGAKESEVRKLLGPPVTEWSLQGYVQSLHYCRGPQRLRVDVDPSGRVEDFKLFKRVSPEYLPPSSVWRGEEEDSI